MAIVIEGASYTAKATVTNKSTRLGAPVAAVLTVKFYGFAGAYPSIPINNPVQAFNFQPGQQGDVFTTFTVPLGTAGQAGEVGAWVEDPSGIELARARESLRIQWAGPQLIYPDDVWETWSLFPAQKNRYKTVLSGYLPGSGIGNAYIQFPALPASFTSVKLTLWMLDGYGSLLYSNDVTLDGASIGTVIWGMYGDETVPHALIFDITGRVSPGQSPLVVIKGSTAVGLLGFYRGFGSIWDGDPTRKYWPKLEVS